jgi:phosphoglycolate phosphatase-like HAD superfamily hydrolase
VKGSRREVRHVVWDWNGTLLDDLAATVIATRASLRGLSRVKVSVGEYRQIFARPVRPFHEALVGRALSDSEWCTVNDRFYDCYRRLESRVRLADGARIALESFHRAGIVQSVLSRTRHERLVAAVEKYELTDYFSIVDGATDHLDSSKSLALRRHLAVAGTDPESVVMVGDTVDDAAAAGTARLGCLLVAGCSFETMAKLQAAGQVVNDLSDVVAVLLHRTG